MITATFVELLERVNMTQFACKDLTRGEENAILRMIGETPTIRKILSGELTIQLLSATLNQFMTVEPDLVFADRIKRGNYGWTNSDLTEKKFPVTEDQHGDWEWKLFRFNLSTSSEEAIRLMKEDGFEPGAIGHILTFGENNPEEQRKYPISGLGSRTSLYGGPRVPVLWRDCGERTLNLEWGHRDWYDYVRFLGVRRRQAV